MTTTAFLNDIYDLIANNPANVGTDFTNEKEITDLHIDPVTDSIFFTDAKTGKAYRVLLQLIFSPSPQTEVTA